MRPGCAPPVQRGPRPTIRWGPLAKELSQEFGSPRDKVWAALPAALESVKMGVDSADEAAGRMEASTGVSLSSWGEKGSVQVSEAGPDRSTGPVSTKLKFGLTGWGKLQKNIKRVFESLDRSLAA